MIDLLRPISAVQIVLYGIAIGVALLGGCESREMSLAPDGPIDSGTLPYGGGWSDRS